MTLVSRNSGLHGCQYQRRSGAGQYVEANNGVTLPGSQGRYLYAGNWNAAMFGAKGYEQVIQSLPYPTMKDKLIAFWEGVIFCRACHSTRNGSTSILSATTSF